MACTKKTNPIRQGAPHLPAKVPGSILRKRAPPGNRRAFRFRPGTRPKIEIRLLQRSANLLLKKKPFARLVREVAQNFCATPRFRPDAIKAL